MSIVLQGSTSGSITLQEPAVAGSNTINLPASTGTLALLQTPSFATTIGLGGATPSTSGAGITFPATQSASTDANTLDDYEEGTWTPTVGGTATYSAQAGTYVKIGRLVYARGTCTINSIGSGSTNQISGLPFTLASVSINGGAFASFGYWANLASNTVALYGSADGGSTTIYFGGKASSGNTIDWTINVWGNGARIDFNITYYANA